MIFWPEVWYTFADRRNSKNLQHHVAMLPCWLWVWRRGEWRPGAHFTCLQVRHQTLHTRGAADAYLVKTLRIRSCVPCILLPGKLVCNVWQCSEWKVCNAILREGTTREIAFLQAWSPIVSSILDIQRSVSCLYWKWTLQNSFCFRLILINNWDNIWVVSVSESEECGILFGQRMRGNLSAVELTDDNIEMKPLQRRE